jgi:hypothetical protein
MAVNDVYANADEINEAFDIVSAALEEDLSDIPGNDHDVRAKHGVTVEYTFMKELKTDITMEDITRLLSSILQFLNQPNLTPQEAFEAWGDGPLQKATGFRYSDMPDTDPNKRRIKQFFVRAASMVLVNPSTNATPRRRNLEYRTNGELVLKRNESHFTGRSNSTRDQNLIYEATEADREWGLLKPVFLNLKDIYTIFTRGQYSSTEKMSEVMTEDDIKLLQKQALNFTSTDNMGTIHGLALMSTRGDAGHFMFAPILQKHIDIASNDKALKAYWKIQHKKGNITEEQMLNFLGYRTNAKGNVVRAQAMFSPKWLAGEIARYEMMSSIMPSELIGNGSELFRRIKIATTPVFTSPLMRDFTAVQIASNEKERGEIVFVDTHGNEGNMMDVMSGMGNKNRTDGASIISRKLTDDIHDAFGGNILQRLFKTVIWKADLSLAVKHEMFEPERNMKIVRVKPDGTRETIAEVDNQGRIFQITADGRQEVDMLMTDDEAKISNYKTGEIINITGKELGLIKYNEPKKTATFAMQWINYIHDNKLLNALRKFMMPRITKRLGSIISLTNAETFSPTVLQKFIESVYSDSPHSITTSLLEKMALGLGMHADSFPMLNKILRSQVITPALSLNDGKGIYADLAPDYFDTHDDSQISIAASDAHQVYAAYVKIEGGSIKEAKKMSIAAMNKWLENNEVKVFVSRSPIPYIGGAKVLRIKSLHNRGGQVVMSANNVIKFLEGDFDGDAVQIEFLPDDLTNAISEYLEGAQAADRMKAISLPSMTEKIDLSKSESVRKLVRMFQAGKRAVGEIAALQNALGQLIHSFNYLQLSDGRQIRIHKLQDKVHFPEMDDVMTLEDQMRIWVQAAVDNGKHLLLDSWGYSREKLIERMFYISDSEGNWQSEITPDSEEAQLILKTLVNLHTDTRNIRKGRTFNFSHSVNTILKSSKKYLEYVNNRSQTIMESLNSKEEIKGMVIDASFNEQIAPLEEVSVAFARLWYGDPKTGLEGLAEPNKISPVEYEQGVYDSVHLQVMAELEGEVDSLMSEAIELTQQITDDTSEAALERMIVNGREYGNRMWNEKGNQGIGEGFSAILERITKNNEEITNASWDYNPDLIRFTAYWGEAFDALNPLEQFSATISFLRGYAQLDAQGDLMYTVNRNILPPVSTKADFTVLDAGLIQEYLSRYNDKLRDVNKRSEDATRIAYDPLSRVLKRVCK